MKHTLYPSALLLSLLLVGCGGGSDKDIPPPEQEPAPTAAAPVSEAEEIAAQELIAEKTKAESEAEVADTPATEETTPPVPPSDPAVVETSEASVVAASTTTLFHLYVATTGSDSNPATKDRPFKTIVKASQVAKPGTTVHVAPGTYPGGFITSTNGTPDRRIRYLSDVKWGAKIVPAANSRTNKAWLNRGNYIDIHGFQLDGRNHVSGTRWWSGIINEGSSIVIKDNYVHHIANRVEDCQSNGGSGINAHTARLGYLVEIYANVVHDIGVKGIGCRWIHGIYMNTSGKVRNNLTYNNGFAGIAVSHDASNLIISNNTVVNNGSGIHMSGSGFYHSTTRMMDYVDVANNIVVNNGESGIRNTGIHGTHNTYTNNLVYGNGQYSVVVRNATAVGTITKDPQFVSSTDFRLKSTSPAINAGDARYAPTTDLLGVRRPVNGRDDLGAYESRY